MDIGIRKVVIYLYLGERRLVMKENLKNRIRNTKDAIEKVKKAQSRINHVVELENEKKYFVFDATYSLEDDGTYILLREVSEDGEDFVGDYLLYRETFENGKVYLEKISDEEILHKARKWFHIKDYNAQ